MFVLADQFIDRTHGRASSFFGKGCVAHVSLAHPVAPLLQDRIEAAAKAQNIACVRGGTYVCMEGPQFSTQAESLAYKAAGHDVIGMTAMPEAKLAREAEISYAIVAMVTDYDCWHPDHDAVDVAAVIKILHDNAEKASRLVGELLRTFPRRTRSLPGRVRPRAGRGHDHSASRTRQGACRETRADPCACRSRLKGARFRTGACR
jgi:5'-methylthioadenosine phosphorylase